jgi:hypothetical protein
MDLLDRYLAAVAALLPKAQRQDIVAELRDLLLSRMEDKEAQLGRPLDRAEREAVLKAFGHPIAVAGRFGTPRSLIGPELYPFYIFAVKAALLLAAGVSVITAVVDTLGAGGEIHRALLRAVSGFLPLALSLIGAATLIGGAIERGWIKLDKSTGDWKVADLPRLDRKGGPFKSRFEALFELAVTVLFVLWWTGLAPAPWVAVGRDGHLALSANPIWAALYVPVLVLALVQVASSLTAVLRPGWVRARAALEIVCNLGGLALVAVLWKAGPLLEVHGLATAAAARLEAVLDQSLRIGLVVAVGVWVVMLAANVWRLARGGPGAPAAV